MFPVLGITLALIITQVTISSSLGIDDTGTSKTSSFLEGILCSTVVYLDDVTTGNGSFNLQAALINHGLITLDLHDNEGSMKLLLDHILIPADSKMTHGKFNVLPGCVSILLISDEIKQIEKVSNIIDKTRIEANMVIVTSHLKLINQAIKNANKKPRFDTVLLEVDEHGNLLHHLEYVARNDPRWRELCISYTRGNPRTFTSSNKDTTLGKDMYGAGVDTITAITQKLGIEKLKYVYGKSRDAVSISLGDGSCDVLVGQIGYAYYRYKIGVEFSKPMNEVAFRIKYKLPGPVDKLYTLTYPFTSGVWIMVMMSLLLVLFFLYLGNRLGDHGVTSKHMFTMSLGGLLSEAMPDHHWWVRYQAKSAYIATFTWLAMACLMVHAYRSTLLACLVSVEYEKPVDTFQDLLDRNIPLALSNTSFLRPMMKYSPDPVVREVEAESVRQHAIITSENRAKFHQMLYEGKVAYLALPILMLGQRHKLGIGHEALPTSYSGWYYGLKWPLTKEFDTALEWLLDTGMYQTYLRPYFWDQSRPERVHLRASSDKENSKDHPLELVQFAPMVLALGMGLSLAIVTFAMELSLTTIARKAFLV